MSTPCLIYVQVDFDFFFLILHSPQTQLCSDHGHSPLMKKVFEVHLCFLQINQSETALKQIFTSLRTFIYKVRRPLEALFVKALACSRCLTSSSSSSSSRARSLKAGLTCAPPSAMRS